MGLYAKNDAHAKAEEKSENHEIDNLALRQCHAALAFVGLPLSTWLLASSAMYRLRLVRCFLARAVMAR